MSAAHSIAYSVFLDTFKDDGFFIYWAMEPWAVGDSDYIALYESYADLELDFQRVAEGKSPDNQKKYEWVKDLSARNWTPGYPAQTGWLAAYWSKNYFLDQYICLMFTPGW